YSVGCYTTQTLWIAIDPRYSLPILPFLYLFWMGGIGVGWKRLSQSRIPVYLTGLLLLQVNLAGNVFAWRALTDGPLPSPLRVPLGAREWIKTHTPAEAIVLSIKAPTVYLYTGRLGLISMEGKDREEFRYALLTRGVNFILIDPIRPIIRPRFQAQPL